MKLSNTTRKAIFLIQLALVLITVNAKSYKTTSIIKKEMGVTSDYIPPKRTIEFPSFEKFKKMRGKEQTEQFIKDDADEIEKELDTVAMMAEGAVMATEEAMVMGGVSQDKINFLDNVIDMIEEVREAEVSYLEEVKEENEREKVIELSELQRKTLDSEAGNQLPSDGAFYTDEDDEEEKLRGIELLEQIEDDMERQKDVIDFLIGEANQEEETEKYSNRPKKAKKTHGFKKMLKNIENQIKVTEENVDETIGGLVVNLIDDSDDLEQQNNKDQQNESSKIEEITISNDNSKSNLAKQAQKSILAVFSDNSDDGQTKKDQIEEEVVNVKRSLNPVIDTETQSNAQKEEKSNKIPLQKEEIKNLIIENQKNILQDRKFGLLTLVLVMGMIFFCFFKNYSDKANEQENNYKKYDKYDSLNTKNDKNNNIANYFNKDYDLEEKGQNDDGNSLGMVVEEAEELQSMNK